MRKRSRGIVIAIDGPAGAGKSTVGKALAARLGYFYLDTGAMYRAIALKVVETGIDPSSEEEVQGAQGERDIPQFFRGA